MMAEYVTKEQVIDWFRPYGHMDEPIPFETLVSDLRGMPAASVAPVRHWRWETANDGTHFCPHCGCDAPYTWDDIDRSFINSADDVPDRPSNYCPNCGAKMDGGAD